MVIFNHTPILISTRVGVLKDIGYSTTLSPDTIILYSVPAIDLLEIYNEVNILTRYGWDELHAVESIHHTFNSVNSPFGSVVVSPTCTDLSFKINLEDTTIKRNIILPLGFMNVLIDKHIAFAIGSSIQKGRSGAKSVTYLWPIDLDDIFNGAFVRQYNERMVWKQTRTILAIDFFLAQTVGIDTDIHIPLWAGLLYPEISRELLHGYRYTASGPKSIDSIRLYASLVFLARMNNSVFTINRGCVSSCKRIELNELTLDADNDILSMPYRRRASKYSEDAINVDLDNICTAHGILLESYE